MGKMDRIIGLGCDHAGYRLKEFIKKQLGTMGYILKDYGTFSEESVDYPDFVHPLAKDINEEMLGTGIIFCGSGNGVAMVANKYPGVRAAVAWTEEIAKFSRAHNDANVLALPARFISEETAITCVNAFLSTDFEGGRHERRVRKIAGSL
jgi:ribose 5-phosphate isomerase B